MLRYKDKFSTIHQTRTDLPEKINLKTTRPIQKPMSIIHYNFKRGTIDKVDMQISLVKSARKSVK